MTENYAQELKLIDAVEKSRGMEWIDELENFGNYFNPAHMRQRIEREMTKDVRIKELEDKLSECEKAYSGLKAVVAEMAIEHEGMF